MPSRRGTVAALLVGSGSQALANAVAALLATRLLAVETRGIMVVCVTLAAIVGLVMSLGTGTALRSLRPQSTVAGMDGLLSAYAWCSLVSLPCASATAAVAYVLMSVVSPSLQAGWTPALAAAAAALPIVMNTQITEAWFAAGHYRRGSWLASAAALLGLGLMLCAAIVQPTFLSLIVAQALGGTLVGVASAAWATWVGCLRWRRPQVEAVLPLLRRGAGSLGMPIGLAVITRSDRLILAAVVSPSAAAVYALASTLSEGLRLIPAAIAQIVTHDVANGLGAPAVARGQKQSLISLSLISGPLVGAAFLLIEPVFGSEYAAASVLLAILVLAELGFAVFWIALRGLVGGGWSAALSILGTATACVAVPIYWLAATNWSGLGCAVATVIIYVLAGAAGNWILRRHLSRRPVVPASQAQ